MRVYFLFIFLAVFLFASICQATPSEVVVGGYLRDVKLDGLDGKTKSFADFKGKPLIINVWASYCGPCFAEMGSLERLAQKFGGKTFNVIGISIDDYRQKAMDFIKRSKVTFENFQDHNLVVENMLGARVVPTTVLVDAEGKVLFKAKGAYQWDAPQMIDALLETFNKR